MTARDVAKSARQLKQALAEKLKIAPAELDRRNAECVADTFRFLSKMGMRKPASDGRCVECGFDPKHAHAAIMVGDMCSPCWRANQ